MTGSVRHPRVRSDKVAITETASSEGRRRSRAVGKAVSVAAELHQVRRPLYPVDQSRTAASVERGVVVVSASRYDRRRSPPMHGVLHRRSRKAISDRRPNSRHCLRVQLNVERLTIRLDDTHVCPNCTSDRVVCGLEAERCRLYRVSWKSAWLYMSARSLDWASTHHQAFGRLHCLILRSMHGHPHPPWLLVHRAHLVSLCLCDGRRETQSFSTRLTSSRSRQLEDTPSQSQKTGQRPTGFIRDMQHSSKTAANMHPACASCQLLRGMPDAEQAGSIACSTITWPSSPSKIISRPAMPPHRPYTDAELCAVTFSAALFMNATALLQVKVPR